MLLPALAVFSVLAHQGSVSGPDFPQPNVVMVVIDDLGYGDIGCYGGNLCPTPNIDFESTQGARMTQGYATSCLCAPSRAGLLTGKYPQRFGFEYNPGDNARGNPNTGLPIDQPTIAERLKARGYNTALIGKWHLGAQAGKSPMDRGFDRFYGIYGGASDYIPGVGSITLWDNRNRTVSTQYITDEYSDQAVNFINAQSKKKPFFLYLSYNAMHVPYQATQKYLDRVPWLTGNQQIYAAMLTAVDDGIGRVRQALANRKMLGTTLYLLLSDNGGAIDFGVASNGILNGGKTDFFEGGIRVPYMVSWPGVIPPQTYTKQVSFLDVVPTVLAATGDPATSDDSLDGVDLVPYLRGENEGVPHPVLFWRKGKLRAIRHDDQKWLCNVDDLNRTFFGMYDLGTDPGERINLKPTQPDAAKALEKEFNAWSKKMMDPLWVP